MSLPLDYRPVIVALAGPNGAGKTTFYNIDNNGLRTPYRRVAIVESGRVVKLQPPVPKWLAPLLPKSHGSTVRGRSR